MSFKLKLLVLVLTFINFSFAFSQNIETAFEGKIIKEIRIQNLLTTSKYLILGLLSISEGDKFEYGKIKKSYNALYELGYFKNIEVKVKEIENTNNLIVTFLFEELPKIGTIRIMGEDEINRDEIINVMNLRPGNVFSKSEMAQDEKRILKLYKDKGFDGTYVNITSQSRSDSQYTNILIQINEGREVYVASVKIIGTKKLDPDDIYDIMLTKESSFLGGGEILNDETLNMDRLRIEQYMKDNGYFTGKVKSVKISKDYIWPDDYTEKDYGYFILIEVEEGKQFKMGDLKISGNTKIKTDLLMSKITVEKGDTYNDTALKKNLNSVKSIYLDKGYIQAKLLPIPIIDEDNLIINWDINIIEGEKVHIENIRIIGNNKTQTYVIDQELKIFEGELFNFQKIKDSVNRLRNTQFFSKIEPLPEPSSESGLVNLNIKLAEQRTGLFNIGGGYGLLTGFSFFEEITEKNFLGTGWTARERGEFGEKRINVELSTSTPWLVPYVPILFNITLRYLRDIVDARYSLDANFVNTNTIYSYVLNIFELDFAIGYYIISEFQLYTGYLISFSKADENKNFSLNNIEKSTTQGSALYTDLESGLKDEYLAKISHRLGFAFDTRDVALNTREGFRIKGVLTYTGGIYSGDSHWLKWDNSGAFYINPWWDLILVFYAGYEILFKQFDGSFVIRDIDRLRFDGINQLRGWRTLTRDAIVGIGGKTAFSTEIRFPIFQEILWGLFFADAGDVTDNVANLPDHLNYYSFGFGFRVQIPLIPIRLYFAKLADYNTTKPNEFYLHNGLEFVFSVGGFF